MVEDKQLSNFIPISRKIFEHKLWTEKRSFSKFEAWVDILKSARFENTEGSILIGNKSIKFKRGQFVASYRFLATRWGWSTKKVGNYLGLLEAESMVKKETPKETGQTIITICKYDSYNIVSEKGKHPKKREGNAMETGRKRDGNEYNIVNKENKEIKEERVTEASSVYPQCVSLYNNFIISQTSLSAKFDAKAGASMKRIIKYFESQVMDKEDPEAIPKALDFILSNYDKWDMFHKKQIGLNQIESNLINIVNSIKNAGYTNSTRTKSRSIFATTN